MPIHDWTRVDAGLFHDFHQSWTISLRNALNRGILPPDFFALAEQHLGGPIPDVIALRMGTPADPALSGSAGTAVSATPPKTRAVLQGEASAYAAKADRIAIRHRHGDIVSVIEIVSPGNKASAADFRRFVDKSVDLIRTGVSLLVIDLFPPGKQDPYGLHHAIWSELGTDDVADMAPEKPLLLASYDTGERCTAYLEPVGVGDVLADMPIFLSPGHYVLAPLERTYMESWSMVPPPLQRLIASA